MPMPVPMPEASTSPALALQAVRLRWPNRPDDTLNLPALQIARGETVFLRGPSGSGKSSLLGLAAGVLLATEGQVSLLGQDWRGLGPSARDRRRADHLGIVFQQFNLLPYLSVLDNVRLPLRFSRRRAQAAPARSAEALLEQVALPAALWGARADQLSVGQQQRVAAARALIGAPDMVIADEPTSALDEPLRDSFMDLLLGHCRSAGAALLFVSHDPRLAQRFDTVLDLPALNQAGRAAAPPLALGASR